MADEKKGSSNRKTNFGSVQGVVKKGSISVDEKGVTSAIVVDNGKELNIKAYKEDKATLIQAAHDGGKEVIFRGAVLGSKKNGNVHLSVNSEGPMNAVGAVSHIRHSGEGKQPFVGFWLMQEVSKGDKTYKIGKACRAFGEQVAELEGLKDGDRISFEGREVAPDQGSDVDALEVTGGVKIEPAAEKQPEEEAEAPGM